VGLSQRVSRRGEHAIVTLLEPDPERYFERRTDRVGRGEEVYGALGVSDRSRQ
jgi:hypothetical protein